MACGDGGAPACFAGGPMPVLTVPVPVRFLPAGGAEVGV